MAPTESGLEGPTLGAVIKILWRRKLLIAGCALAFAVVTALISLAMPRTYQVRCTLLPPVENSTSLIGFGSSQSPLGILGLQDESSNSARLFLQMLESRTVIEAVIHDLDVLSWLDLSDRSERAALEIAVRTIRRSCDFEMLDPGMIEILAKGSTGWFAGAEADEVARQRVAALANSFVTQLDRVNREKNVSRTKLIRLYLERQLAENEAALEELGAGLTGFREEHGAVALDFQTKALVENASILKARLLEKEIALGIALQTMTGENPIIRTLRNEIDGLRAAVATLETTRQDQDETGAAERTGVSAAAVPQLQYRLAMYEQELQAQLQVQTFIREQYYQAKIEEARDTPTIQILDPAVPPDERVSPKRSMMVVGSGFAGALAGVVAAAVLEWLRGKRTEWAT